MSTARDTFGPDVRTPDRPGRAAVPVWRIGISRGRAEMLQFVRDRTALVFTFAFPALLLVLFGTIFRDENEYGVSASQIFTASMIAYGIVNTAFITMGAGIAVDREDGTLKRLRGTTA